MVNTERIVNCARTFMGTPWHHCGRLKGPNGGIDCVGLLVGVASELRYNFVDPKHYSRYPDGKAMVEALTAWLDEVPKESRRQGDVLVFQFTGLPQHVGLMTNLHGSGMIHTYQSLGKVVEHALSPSWIKRMTHVFRWRDNSWQL